MLMEFNLWFKALHIIDQGRITCYFACAFSYQRPGPPSSLLPCQMQAVYMYIVHCTDVYFIVSS